MQIETTLRFHLILVRKGIIKKKKTTNAGEDIGIWGKGEPLHSAGRNVN
jgi:hypothetical protein